jgi:hypothetical protein
MRIKYLLIILLSIYVSTEAKINRNQNQHLPKNINKAAVVAATVDRSINSLPIKRVILYSNGVAYIERRGMVSGDAEVSLSFKQSQVDDVLKSMVVLDLGQGRIGAVSYNSSSPPSSRMADIPFSIGSHTNGDMKGGLAGVLSQLQGARVLVNSSQRTATGSILTVEERKSQIDSNKPPLVTHTLVITGENGELIPFELAAVRSIKLLDDGTKRDINEFTNAIASTRRRDAKTIVVTSNGTGSRELLISYTIAAPIWKTTYRVILDAEGKPFFQGWAIVDNVSEEDWDNVQLSLISGTPISFIQPVQQPFYRHRPVIPMREDLRLSPQIYEPGIDGRDNSSGSITGIVTDPTGAVVTNATVTIKNTSTNQEYTLNTNSEGLFRSPMLSTGNYRVTVSSNGFKVHTREGVVVSPSSSANLNVVLEVGSVTEAVIINENKIISELPVPLTNNFSMLSMRAGSGIANTQAPAIADAITSGKSGVDTAAEGSEVGDLFEYQIAQPVTVKRDRSALIPILQTRMEGERVSIYNEEQKRNRPMSGLLLKNSSSLTLEDGALTVIEGNAYAGEALMERLKPEEKRLISFALDLGTLVNVEEDDDTSPASYIRITNGVLYAHKFNLEKKLYTLTNQTDKKRTVYIEHPVREDWELDDKESPKPEGKSARYYRFRVELAPKQTVKLPVVEREETRETYALTDVTTDRIEFFVTNRYIDEQLKASLQNILNLKTLIFMKDSRIAAIDKEIDEIAEDQKRLRENIEALNKTAEAKQLIARYVSKADQQETQLEQFNKEKRIAIQQKQELQQQLNSAIGSLELERKL